MPCSKCCKRKKKEEKPRQSRTLRKVAVGLESSRFAKLIRKIDLYGLAGAQGRGSTAMGGIMTLLFAVAILIMNILNLIQLVQSQRSLTSSYNIYLNPHEKVPFTVNGFGKSGVEMNFPVLDISVQNEILFFEVDKPSLQKIAVVDNTFYNPLFMSNFSDPPVTKSAYTDVSVPFNSVQLNIPGAKPAVVFDVNEMILSQYPSKFSQDLQTLDLIKGFKAMRDFTFHPHNVSLYVRFQRSQLQQLLTNQLDIALFNTGEWKSFNNSPLFWELSTLTTDSTLHDITQVGSQFNVLALRTYLDYNTADDADSMNWNVGIQYSPNFNYTLTSHYCFNSSTNTLTESTFDLKAWIIPPTAGATTIEIANYTVNLKTPPVPFSILIMNNNNRETAYVDKVTGNTLHLQYPISTDFYTQSITCNETNAELSVDLFLMPPPQTLPPKIFSALYNALIDTIVWYQQASCECYKGIPNLFCALCKGAQTAALERDGSVCGIDNTDHTTLQPTWAIVSMVCDDGRPTPIGDTILCGSFGLPRHSTYPCPEDEYYNGEAIFYTDDHSIWCNEKPILQLTCSNDGYRVTDVINPAPVFDVFNATYTYGAVNYSMEGISYKQIVSFFSYSPNPTECNETKLAIPEFSFGTLIAPINSGEVLLKFRPDILLQNNYLPSVGPYTAQIYSPYNEFTSYELIIDSASCPDANGIQQVTLQASLPPSIIRGIQDSFATTTTYQMSSFGTPFLLVTNNQFLVARACSDILGTSSNTSEIVIGTDNAVNFVAYVNDIIGEDDTSCCDISSFLCFLDDDIALMLVDPLPYTVDIGAPVHSNILPPKISLVSVLTGIPTSKDNALVYKTQERYREYPVPNLDLEIAVFIVPQKKGFEELPKLCDLSSSEFVPTKGDWHITRPATVQDCAIAEPSMDTLLCTSFECDTNDIMNPTKIFKFKQSLPVNFKWAKNSLGNSVNSPEYTIDTSTVYYFDYTETNLQTGNQFSANVDEQGDFDQNLNKLEFSGEMDFIGRSSSNDSTFSLYPANAPILNFQVDLDANKTATIAMLHLYGESVVFEKVWNAIGWSTNTVDKFSSVSLRWPGILPLTLQPGYNYTFKASITVQPTYDVGLIGGKTLRGWQSSTETSFEKVKIGLSNQANVRLQINFVRNTSVLENRVIYTAFDFLSSLGASIALFGLGLKVLSGWQGFTINPEVRERENKLNPYTEPPNTSFPSDPSPLSDSTSDIGPNYALGNVVELRVAGE